MSLAVVVLPGAPSTPEAATRRTVASVRAEAGADVPVLALEDARRPAADGVRAAAAETVLAAADVLALAREGDVWTPGALADRLHVFERRDVALGAAGHRIVTEGGPVTEVRPPFPPVDPAELLLRPLEASTVLVRPSALTPDALRLLCGSPGDAVVFSSVARTGGYVATGVLAADVALDPERHGTRSGDRLDLLLEAARGSAGDEAGGSTLRRELLRRLFLDAPPDVARPSLAELLDGSPERARAVVADLEWALARQAEALAAERVTWAWGEVLEPDRLPVGFEPTIHELTADVEWLHREVQHRDRAIDWLHAEVALRDAVIARLEGA